MYAAERQMIAHMLIDCGFHGAAKMIMICSDSELYRRCAVYADLFDLQIPGGREYLESVGLIGGDSLAN